jgi:hypothetical protein
MRIKSTQNRERKILKSLKYLVLTAAILLGATGVSNANSFTVTADIGCDPTLEGSETASATLTSVSATVDAVPVSGTIDFGEVNAGFTKNIDFTLMANGAIDCDDNETPGTITIVFTDIHAVQALTNANVILGTSGTFSTNVSSTTVTFTAPRLSDGRTFNESITFAIASP